MFFAYFLKDSQNFFIQSFLLYKVILFSMWWIIQMILDIEYTQEICLPIFVVEELSGCLHIPLFFKSCWFFCVVPYNNVDNNNFFSLFGIINTIICFLQFDLIYMIWAGHISFTIIYKILRAIVELFFLNFFQSYILWIIYSFPAKFNYKRFNIWNSSWIRFSFSII